MITLKVIGSDRQTAGEGGPAGGVASGHLTRGGGGGGGGGVLRWRAGGVGGAVPKGEERFRADGRLKMSGCRRIPEEVEQREKDRQT